ncbi:alpha/beta hydrolase [Rhodanobacter sp. Si-c]|uniref:Alpha/beta hydrolase n=1 Tax=Rhodanobacter lycopersici TaxID=3162487 RepID=A0ABV3QES6_9GAMM
MQVATRPFSILLAVLLLGVVAPSFVTPAADAPPPGVPAGKIVRLDRFPSQYVAPHDVDVWLPPDYPKQAPYAVLYMLDGQNLFGEREAGKMQSWHAAATAAQLIAAGKTRPFIIVGIANAQSLRMSEYFPQQPWESLTPAQRRTLFAQQLGGFQILPVAPYSDAFLKFVTQELKPAIDQRFAVDAKPEATFVMGSSMGGLMAWYALAEYPGTFGGAACLSTHWPGPYLSLDAKTDDPAPDAFVDYIQRHFPAPDRHRIYFDHGTRTLDAYYGPIQARVDRLLQAKGWRGSHFESRVFEGAEHSEKSWAARLAIPLTFLLAPASK